MSDYKGQEIGFTHDKNDNIISRTLPTGEVTRYGYDSNNNQNRVTYPNGTTIHYRYDNADRITSMTATNPNKAGSEAITYSYGYDKTDNLVEWQTAQISGQISYDKTGLLTGESVTYPNGSTLTNRVTYTDAGYVRTQTQPDGTTISYEYNEMGELDSITIPDEGPLCQDSCHP